MNKVAGKFAFLKPAEELHIWYGIAVSVWQIELEIALPISVCELPKLGIAWHSTSNYYTLS